MLSTTGANILKPNHSTTAIANHCQLPFFLFHHHTFHIDNCKRKKLEQKNIFVAQDLLCQFGREFGTRFAEPAILAVFARDLPFWLAVAIFASR
jgi:hypothetical protein